ncbi:MAG: hypothetical protein HYV07_21915 [Deltaproteobacteria bacterium]|nr:hypothetical protein [Deltaproteobacteria bacterium]
MRRWIWVLLVVAGCASETIDPRPAAALRLVRGGDGAISISLEGASEARAIEAELVIESEGTWILDAVRALDPAAIDTVRGRMRGTNRAIVFIGDLRGAVLPAGAMASIELRAGGTVAPGRIHIERASVARADGERFAVSIGGSLSIP